MMEGEGGMLISSSETGNIVVRIVEALRTLGGKGTGVEITAWILKHHGNRYRFIDIDISYSIFSYRFVLSVILFL